MLVKIGKLFLASVAVLALTAPFAFASELVLDDFSTSQAGKFPKRWRTWPFQRGKAADVYKIAQEDGMKFIRAFDDHDASQQIFFNFDWDVKTRPILSWKWRATALPEGAKESDDNMNDSACGVYAVIGRLSGRAIKYVWSSSLPVNTVVTRREGRLKIKVLDSGPAKTGTWVDHKVDVIEDYRAMFGNKLKEAISGIAILTDGNAVHKPAGCDYADFAISN